MPDLTIETYLRCPTAVYWQKSVKGSKGDIYMVVFDGHSHRSPDYTHDYSCSCPSYEFAKGQKECKHIKAVKSEHCQWSEFVSGEKPMAGKNGVMLCPNCGKACEVERIGV